MKNDNDTSDDETNELEAMIARRFGRGKGKCKGKLPIIYFHATRLVILLLDILTKKTRMKGRKENTKEEEITKTSRRTRNTRKKVRKLIILLK